ncbi:MAG TPA: hypothetical protein VML75_05440 [Kofleriaceae bacterium]|nr:hypothetical protein [Kofleriaceae bacterium]
MTTPYPTKRSPLDRMGYGKPWHLLTDQERAAQGATWVYAHTDEDWIKTDLPGRPVSGPVDAGAHEAVPGEPHSDDVIATTPATRT